MYPNRLLVVDESALSLDRYNNEELWLAKVARHHGHSSIFIGQDYVDVPKGIRTQCTQIFVFACDKREAFDLANKYDNPTIAEASKQQTGEFIRILSPNRVTRGKIDFKMGKILLQKE